MTREETIRIMREVCDKDKVDAWHDGFWVITQEELERLVARVEVEEREACWNILFEYAGRDDLLDSDESLLKHLCDLIAARDDK